MPAAFCIEAQADLYYSLIALALTYTGVIAGHGRYYTLGRGDYPDRRDNLYGRITSAFFDLKDRYTKTFDFLAMTLTGIHLGAPMAVLAALTGHWPSAVAIFLGGFLKGAVYELGWRMFWRNKDPIASIEPFYGAILGASYAVAAVFIWW